MASPPKHPAPSSPSHDLLQYFHDILMEDEDPSEQKCSMVESPAYRATAMGFYDILNESTSNPASNSPSDWPNFTLPLDPVEKLDDTLDDPADMINETIAAAGDSSLPELDFETIIAPLDEIALHPSSSVSRPTIDELIIPEQTISSSELSAEPSVSALELRPRLRPSTQLRSLSDLPTSLPANELHTFGTMSFLAGDLQKPERSATQFPFLREALLQRSASGTELLRRHSYFSTQPLDINEGNVATSQSNQRAIYYLDSESRHPNPEKTPQLSLYANLPPTLDTVSTLERQWSAESDPNLHPTGGQIRFGSRDKQALAMQIVKHSAKVDAMDLRALLLECAQALAACDLRKAQDFVQRISKNSSPTGSFSQRLAHYFVEALIARLSGNGARLYAMSSNRPSALEMLKSHYLFAKVCPFLQLSRYFTNFNILKAAEGASRVHIVDYGILYGLHWPGLMRDLVRRSSGPPQLRITGIEFPLSGPRPSERLEDTGRRLTEHAKTYGVPFEFQGVVASNWEKVQRESLNLRSPEEEVLVVCCSYRLRHLMDESTMQATSTCPRQQVLCNIREINPKLFVQGVVNAGCSAAFFVSRIREALFHFSSIYDLLESTMEEESPERMLMEKEILGREILNVVACEDEQRLERPETYRQWQSRTQRAGFQQVRLHTSMLAKATSVLGNGGFHKDFVVDRDGDWFMLGWKGRIIHALSAWQPCN